MTHKEVLTEEQINFLPLLKKFSKDFGLVGGTAMALYLGHRRSIDFDLFTFNEFNNFSIRKKITNFYKIERVVTDQAGQYTVIIKGVRFTFFQYPFAIKFSKQINSVIKLPDLLTLAAMKAYALGRRAKWKDYVDIYFVAKKYRGLKKIIKKAERIFSREFNEKLFRTQLAYFKDINYTEEVIYLKGFEVDDKIVKKELVNYSLT